MRVLTSDNKLLRIKMRHPGGGNVTGKRSTYDATPKHQFTCRNVTISVLNQSDDLMMTHEVQFNYQSSHDINICSVLGTIFDGCLLSETFMQAHA